LSKSVFWHRIKYDKICIKFPIKYLLTFPIITEINCLLSNNQTPPSEINMEASRLLQKTLITLQFFGISQIVKANNQYKTNKCRTFISIFIALCFFLHGPVQMSVNESWKSMNTAHVVTFLAWTLGNGMSLSLIITSLILKQRKVLQFYVKLHTCLDNIEQLFGQKIQVKVRWFLIILVVHYVAGIAIDSYNFQPMYILEYLCMLYNFMLVAYFGIYGFVLCAMYKKIRESCRNILEIHNMVVSNTEKTDKILTKVCCCCWVSGRNFALDVGQVVGPLNYSRCDTILPCTITPFY